MLGMYAASRIYSTLLLLIGLWVATAHGWRMPWLTDTPTFARIDGVWVPHTPDFFGLGGLWDGVHYQQIADQGYPSVLPRTASGTIAPNDWAFLPAYPLFVAAFAAVLHAPFEVLAVIVSALFGAGATVLLYLMVRDRVGHRPAMLAATVFSFGPLAFLLQVGYAESMFLFLLFAAMYLMQRRRWGLMLVPAALAAFTRPGEVALALAIAVVFVVRLRQARSAGDPAAFPVRERVAMVVATAVTGLVGFAWPLVAWIVTGVPNAYTATELSWRDGFLGHTDFRPFTAWFELFGRYLGAFGVAIVVAAILGFAWWLTRPTTRSLGPVILSTAASYALYLLAVFMPQQSVFRVAIPLAPLLGDPRFAERDLWRRMLVGLGALAQPVCVAVLWFYANP